MTCELIGNIIVHLYLKAEMANLLIIECQIKMFGLILFASHVRNLADLFLLKK